MPTLRRFMSSRCLLGFLAAAAVLFGLAMLHPYPRQSLFGPTIRGKPRWYWETEVRRMGNQPPSMTDTIMAWFGLERQTLEWVEVFDNTEMVTIVTEMLDDRDHETRDTALNAIIIHSSLQDQAALPSLRKLLGSDDIIERALSAQAIWRISRDPQVIPVILELLDQKALNYIGIGILAEEIADTGGPEVHRYVSARATDANPDVRSAVMTMMRHSRKKGVPVLIKGLNDPNNKVRQSAAWALRGLGPDAADAIPALERTLTEDDATARNEAIRALLAIEPKRFQHLKAERN